MTTVTHLTARLVSSVKSHRDQQTKDAIKKKIHCRLKPKHGGEKSVISDDIGNVFPMNYLQTLSSEGLGYSVTCKNKSPTNTHFLKLTVKLSAGKVKLL